MVYFTTFSQCCAILVYVLQILMRQQHIVPQYECHDWSSRCVYSRLNKPQTNIETDKNQGLVLRQEHKSGGIKQYNEVYLFQIER
jgi:hypothetical protein